jgi:hypothetical protein
MRTKTLVPFALLALVLALKGDSCLIEDRTIEAVVTHELAATWLTQGDNAAGSDMANVALAGDVEEALAEFEDVVAITSIHIAGGTYEVLDNRGFVGAHTGAVTIEADGQAALTILEYDVPNPPGNTTGASGGTGVDVTLVADGITFLNSRLDAYLASRNPELLEFTFRTTWESTDPGASEYDFDWKTALVLQVVGQIEVEVPNP